MAISVFPAPSTSSAGAKSFIATSAAFPYQANFAVAAGTYEISFAGGGTVTIILFNGDTYVNTYSSLSTTNTFSVASPGDSIIYFTSTATNASIVMTLTAETVASVSGTIENITTSSTYSNTGYAYCVLLGGGGGGGGSGGSFNRYGGFTAQGTGGGSGYAAFGLVTLTSNMAVVIGQLGTGASPGGSGGTGGTTTFAGLTAAGGTGGSVAGSYGAAGGAGGAAGGTADNSASSRAGGNGSVFTPGYGVPVTASMPTTTGSGGGGGAGNSKFIGRYSPSQPGYEGGTGGAGTVGTGGNGGAGGSFAGGDSSPTQQGQTGFAGTGYGSGGGGAGGRNYQGPTLPGSAKGGGNGGPGVVRLLKFA
jgi:hypothetical protein